MSMGRILYLCLSPSLIELSALLARFDVAEDVKRWQINRVPLQWMSCFIEKIKDKAASTSYSESTKLKYENNWTFTERFTISISAMMG